WKGHLKAFQRVMEDKTDVLSSIDRSAICSEHIKYKVIEEFKRDDRVFVTIHLFPKSLEQSFYLGIFGRVDRGNFTPNLSQIRT
ncbi:MAG: hypothetical protein MK076_11520, partial [Flavobacteriales bacterium]|nr:hypothetical protein [Flavobacteriales bacterium]